jgi:hypothetical protein
MMIGSARQRWLASLVLLFVAGTFPGARGASQEGAIRFENVTGTSNLAFVLQHHATPDKFMVETMAGGVAVFDYDGDGRPDIFFTNGAALPSLQKETPADWNRLYHNEGGFRFSDVTEKAGVKGVGYTTGAAVGDYDNDGREDLFVAGVQRNQLLHNAGNGSFTDVTVASGVGSYAWSVAAGWLDYDNDGWLDLFVVNYVDWTPQTNKFCGDRGRNLQVYCHPKHYRGLANGLYRNRHDGTFEDVSAKSRIAASVGKGMSVAFADYDGDGFTDIFVTNDAIDNVLFHNRGDGTFEEVALLAGVAVPAHGRPVSSMGTDFRDYDNDGWPDIVVTALTGETFPLFRNEKGKFFRDVTYASGLGSSTVRMSGWAAALLDLDNDGWKDLVTANSHANDRIEEYEATSYRQANGIFRNTGTRLEDVSAVAGPDFQVARAHRGIGVGDFDGDGRLDLVTTVLGGQAQVLRNVSPGNHGWITLKLAGGPSNSDGIGARVRLGAQADQMTTSVGYASASNFGVHFGLGDVASVPRIEITWPSGAIQVLENVPANQVVTVKEAKSGSGSR